MVATAPAGQLKRFALAFFAVTFASVCTWVPASKAIPFFDKYGAKPHVATLLLSALWLVVGNFAVVAGHWQLWLREQYHACAAYRATLSILTPMSFCGSAKGFCRRWGKQLSESRIVAWQDRYYGIIACLMAFALPIGVCGLCWGDWTGGILWNFARIAIARYFAFSVDVPLIAGLTGSTSWAAVRGFAALGITYDLKKRTTTNSPKASSSGKQMRELCAGCDPRYWHVHGKAYDLTEYADRHPGGRLMLMSGKGREITELVESVHALTAENWKKVLEKYEVTSPDVKTAKLAVTWVWDDKNSFYQELKRRVIARFNKPGAVPQNLVGPLSYWAWLVPFLGVVAFVTYKWLSTGSFLFGLAAGSLSCWIGFNVIHTASHGGFTHNPFIETTTFVTLANYFGIFHTTWLQHHVWGHHSYTGAHKLDPDLANGYPIVRKHKNAKYYNIFKHQWYTSFLLLVVFPNQMLGQIFVYLRSFSVKRLFGMSIVGLIDGWRCAVPLFTMPTLTIISQVLVPLYLHGVRFLPSLVAFWSAFGFFYWALVFPNHDTEHETVNSPDWGVQQVTNSGDFYLPKMLAQMTGGMNYQIEHHLFPGAHPAYYPEIQKIVRQLCKEKNVPYNFHSSWFSALRSHFKFLVKNSIRPVTVA